MPNRAIIERRFWLISSIATAVAFVALQSSPLPDYYALALAVAPLLLLAGYVLLRGRGRDTRLLAIMLALEGVGSAIGGMYPTIGINLLLLGFLVGLSLFLTYRTANPDPDRKVAAVVLLLGTPALFFATGSSSSIFFALALGGMAASAWVSAFSRPRVGLGAVLIVVGVVLEIMTISEGQDLLLLLAWALFYVGNLLMAIGVTREVPRHAST
ncbi:hypothetical protein WSK_1118 [Novosphingobium sp. Rr 2-17]|uniref:hypothetical protein n=1 Tax=Novosphingobium sp. Rr 2-17 TaxID=555793 RepID=UPI000269A4B0|nr:hypothetical protein [Novosphingobium sp. Rr 2-17]EIZ80325.1 hypothetical protein WSK_1118 [Novosphingobium sp. Rr 2-17]